MYTHTYMNMYVPTYTSMHMFNMTLHTAASFQAVFVKNMEEIAETLC